MKFKGHDITSPEERWEKGIVHDTRSEEIYKFMAALDYEHCSDSLCLTSGGDGDNGEQIMYLLDCYFEAADNTPAKQSAGARLLDFILSKMYYGETIDGRMSLELVLDVGQTASAPGDAYSALTYLMNKGKK